MIPREVGVCEVLHPCPAAQSDRTVGKLAIDGGPRDLGVASCVCTASYLTYDVIAIRRQAGGAGFRHIGVRSVCLRPRKRHWHWDALYCERVSSPPTRRESGGARCKSGHHEITSPQCLFRGRQSLLRRTLDSFANRRRCPVHRSVAERVTTFSQGSVLDRS